MDPFRQSRESRILGADGRPYQYPDDPPPAARRGPADDMPLPHVLTFSALLNSASRVYYSGRWDEAMRHSRQDAVLMENDCFLMGLMQERTRTVTSLPWHLETDDEDDPIQALVRDHLTTALKRTPRFRYLLKWLYRDGTWKGRTAAQFAYRWEQIKDPNGAPQKTLTVKRWLPVNGDKINHTWDHTPTVQVNTAFTQDLPGAEYVWNNEGRALVLKGTWRDRFQLYYNDPQDQDFFDGIFSAEAVHGLGVRSVVFWWNWIRLERLGQVASFLDRVGLGITLWYFELGNAASEAAVTKAAKEQSGRVNIILPRAPNSKGQGLERVETPVSGAEAVARIAEVLEAYIERYIVGQAMSGGTDAQGSLGGTGRAEFAADTKADITEEGASNLAESLTGSDVEFGLVRHLHRHTFPQYAPGGADGFEVRFKLGVKDADSDKRLKAMQTAVALIGGQGVKADDVRNAAGLAKPKEGDETCQGGMGMGVDGGDEGVGRPQPPGGDRPNPRKGDWSPFHGPRGGVWERNAQSGTVRHPRARRPEGGARRRFRMGADGRPEWVGPWRFEGGNSFDPGGKWITIGGHAGPHGERHASGTPVEVGADGRVEKGPAALKGKPAAHPDQSGPGKPSSDLDPVTQALGMGPAVREVAPTRRQEGARNAADVRQARRKELAERIVQWEADARAKGITRTELRGVVEDMRGQDLERVRDHNAVLKHATALLKHYGTDPGVLKRRLNDAQIDAPKVKGLDLVAMNTAATFHRPDLEDPEVLLAMIEDGPLKPMSEEGLYEEAQAYLEDLAEFNARNGGGAEPGDAAEPEGDAGFDPAEFDEPTPAVSPAAENAPQTAKKLAASANPRPPSANPVPPSTPAPVRRPGTPMHANDILLPSWAAAAELPPKRPIGPGGVGAVRKYGMRESVGRVLRWLAGERPGRVRRVGPDRFAFDADQPRVPKGQEGGGEWTDAHRAAHATRAEAGPHNLAPMPAVRKRLAAEHGLADAAAQDAAIHEARQAGLVSGSAWEGARGMTPEQAAGMKAALHRGPGGDEQIGFLSLRPGAAERLPESIPWADERLGARGDALHAHATAGDHGKALDLFRAAPHAEAKRLFPELPGETVAALDRESRKQHGLFPDAPADLRPRAIGKGDDALRALSVVQKRGPHWDMPQPDALGAFRVRHLPTGNAIHSDPLSGQYVVKDKAGKKLAGPFEQAGEAAAHVEGPTQTQGAKDATGKVEEQHDPRPQHRAGDQGGQVPQAGGGDRVQRPAEGEGAGQVTPRPEPGSREHWAAAGWPAEDFDLAEKAAPAELAAWQARAKHHHGLAGITAKLKHRGELEAAFKALQGALRAAKKPRKFWMRGRPRRHAATETPAAPSQPVVVNVHLPGDNEGAQEFVRDPKTGLVTGTRRVRVVEEEVVRDPETQQIIGKRPKGGGP